MTGIFTCCICIKYCIIIFNKAITSVCKFCCRELQTVDVHIFSSTNNSRVLYQHKVLHSISIEVRVSEEADTLISRWNIIMDVADDQLVCRLCEGSILWIKQVCCVNEQLNTQEGILRMSIKNLYSYLFPHLGVKILQNINFDKP